LHRIVAICLHNDDKANKFTYINKNPFLFQFIKGNSQEVKQKLEKQNKR
jgi:hypothetical protein